jgi:hypothetical protein
MDKLAILFASLMIMAAGPAAADPFLFSTGNVNGLMAAATRPSSNLRLRSEMILKSPRELN